MVESPCERGEDGRRSISLVVEPGAAPRAQGRLPRMGSQLSSWPEQARVRREDTVHRRGALVGRRNSSACAGETTTTATRRAWWRWDGGPMSGFVRCGARTRRCRSLERRWTAWQRSVDSTVLTLLRPWRRWELHDRHDRVARPVPCSRCVRPDSRGEDHARAAARRIYRLGSGRRV